MRRTWWFLAAVTILGCGDDGGSGAPGDAAVAVAEASRPGADVGAALDQAAATPDAAASADGAGALTDREWCEQACTKLASCGVLYDASCPTNCLAAPVFLACIKRSVQECNPLALCTFRQASAIFCGNEMAAYPAGQSTCATAATCEGVCTAQNQPASCRCACWNALSPAKALNLLINNECATARCRVECNTPGAGAACLSCFNQSCGPQNAQCVAS
jgi:hypothetical protein